MFYDAVLRLASGTFRSFVILRAWPVTTITGRAFLYLHAISGTPKAKRRIISNHDADATH
jgi:hypothetical protein